MFGEDWLKFLCKSIHLVVCLCRKQIEEDCGNIVKQVIIAIIILCIDNRIVECRRLRIINELINMFIITTDAFHEGFLVMLHLYKVERWSLMWGCIFLKKWINHNYIFLRPLPPPSPVGREPERDRQFCYSLLIMHYSLSISSWAFRLPPYGGGRGERPYNSCNIGISIIVRLTISSCFLSRR